MTPNSFLLHLYMGARVAIIPSSPSPSSLTFSALKSAACKYKQPVPFVNRPESCIVVTSLY